MTGYILTVFRIIVILSEIELSTSFAENKNKI